MKSRDAVVRELLAEESEVIKVRLPMPFYQRLIAAGKRRFSTNGGKKNIAPKALTVAAAYGLLAWEAEMGEKKRGPKPKGTISKKPKK